MIAQTSVRRVRSHSNDLDVMLSCHVAPCETRSGTGTFAPCELRLLVTEQVPFEERKEGFLVPAADLSCVVLKVVGDVVQIF